MVANIFLVGKGLKTRGDKIISCCIHGKYRKYLEKNTNEHACSLYEVIYT
jgi:acyl-CoA hydrolase